MKNVELIENQEVIVHSSAIQITNNISLLQRKTWLNLLYHAYPVLLKQAIFTINVKDLIEQLGFDSKNEKYLKDSLKSLTNISVEWNIFNKDKKNVWEVSSLLAAVKIEDGLCTYEMSEMFRKKLFNPEMYVKVCLSLQNKFQSKNAHALYLLLLDYAFQKTVTLTIEQIRKYLALTEKEYGRTNDFIHYVIKKSVQEINTLSNLYIETEYIKKGRKIMAIKFLIAIDKSHLPNLTPPKEMEDKIKSDNLDSEIINFKPESDLKIKDIKLKTFFSTNDISLKVLKGLIKEITDRDYIPEEYHENYFTFLKDYCDKQNNVKNMAGLFINLVKTGEQAENYLFKVSEQMEKKKNVQKELEEKYKQKIKIHYEYEELGTVKNYLTDKEELFYRLIENNKDNFAIMLALKKNNGKMNLDLLKNSGVLRTLVNQVQQESDYSFISFEQWKKQWEANSANKELMNRAKKEAGWSH